MKPDHIVFNESRMAIVFGCRMQVFRLNRQKKKTKWNPGWEFTFGNKKQAIAAADAWVNEIRLPGQPKKRRAADNAVNRTFNRRHETQTELRL